MEIIETNNNVYMLVQKEIPISELKVTENGRFLWMHEGLINNVKAKCRISFHEPNDSIILKTEHVYVRKNGDKLVDISILIESPNKCIIENGEKYKIIEKEKGINCKCIFASR